MTKTTSAFAVTLGVALWTTHASAVRPFITDDARVVGLHQAQLETWVRYDKGSLQHWIVPAFGPIAPLEVTLGAVHGVAIDPARRYSLAAPLVQAKLLLHAAEAGGGPGVAVIGGTFLPFGFGGFESPLNAFAYAAATQVFGDDDVLLHANVGAAAARAEPPTGNTPQEGDRHARFRWTWGLGSQIHLYGVANLALEVFSGDPYAEVAGGAGQAGFRFVLSSVVQV
ncbi:MAG: hypothetical protein JNL79_15805, partial [Myxococcales bacterium]|nr:hypothetical protein [Myxococcales bacterium]